MVDTNVLVYAANREAPEHPQCRPLLERWRSRREPWYLTWGIVYEFLRIVTHPRVMPSPWTTPEALEFVKAVLASPALIVLQETRRHGEVLAELSDATARLEGNLFHDAHTAALMKEHGISVIYTRDMDFHHFPGIEVRDPLAG